jgi:hypothetical protein
MFLYHRGMILAKAGDNGGAKSAVSSLEPKSVFRSPGCSSCDEKIQELGAATASEK